MALPVHIKQLLDEVEQNVVICQWRADSIICETMTNYDILLNLVQ